MAANQERLEFANTLRGLAALLVVIAHTVLMFWDKKDRAFVAFLTNAIPLPVETHSAPFVISLVNRAMAYTGIAPGALGVAIFFLISGFVIPVSLRSNSVPAFLTGRIFRILPVYMVGFSITLLAIFWSGSTFGKPWPFTFAEVAIHYVPGLRDLLWSRSIDGISWTLEIEVKFYIVLAICAWPLRRLSPAIFIVPVVLCLAGMAIWNIPEAVKPAGSLYFLFLGLPRCFAYIAYMFCGVLFYYVHVGSISRNAAVIPMIGLLALSGVTLRHTAVSEFASFINYAIAILIFALAFRYRRSFRAGALTGFLADISYPLYVVHSIAGYVLMRALVDVGMPAMLATGSTVLASILCAWLIHIAVEKPARDYGKHLAKTMTRFARPADPRAAA
ncbi:acyltransferase family protein [Rhizobiales bacterium RZME27]|uniref:Acyltransferase family protein n=1 Tax=Endobacterium cereale TaxID=2663029 RepID=A0A6A8AFF6_9HYPH|nr:acyltransferase [Endobacterium cereale]MEB2847102.1 acyltransferase [Endobacterium cereale]MQY47481.1 acyltransferase family protein [Endobacterium cereale]